MEKNISRRDFFKESIKKVARATVSGAALYKTITGGINCSVPTEPEDSESHYTSPSSPNESNEVAHGFLDYVNRNNPTNEHVLPEHYSTSQHSLEIKVYNNLTEYHLPISNKIQVTTFRKGNIIATQKTVEQGKFATIYDKNIEKIMVQYISGDNNGDYHIRIPYPGKG